ncbi:MAG: methyl-accepting chemotaxis protein [Thermodesulfobacteriota bacterium]|nr:methyl-accepting chemotaxis protein [Thermodesulfobacteriota bacterium]
MPDLLKTTLKWRLLAAFSLCALLTGFSGGAGILSLRQIQGNMKLTTEDIGGNIDMQNAQALQLMPLRPLVAFIISAKDQDALDEAAKRLQALFDLGQAEPSGKLASMMAAAKRLLTQRRNELRAAGALSSLRTSNVEALDEVTRLAMTSADDVEFDAVTNIEGVIAESRNYFEKMSSTTGRAASAITSALSVRTACNALNAKVTEALLAADRASVRHVQTQVTNLLGSLKEQLAALPKDGTTAKLEKDMDTLVSIVHEMLEVKAQTLLPGADANNTVASNLAALRNELNAALEQVTRQAMNRAANVESDVGMDGAMVEIQTSFDKISSTTGAALSTLKAALSIRASCNELNAKANDALLVVHAASVDYAQTEVGTLFGNMKNDLQILPKNAAMAKLEEGINALAGIVEKMFQAKRQMLVAGNELKGTSAKIYEEMGKLDSAMLATSKGLKASADKALEKNASLVNRWQYFQVFLALASAILALAVGLYVSGSITKPINGIITGLRKGAHAVTFASGQVSSSSQHVAAGASSQAASLEQTSSSLEEMSSMTKQNADNAHQADSLMKEANQIVAQADESMDRLTTSMGEISKASEETSKIIKTIDEIAFQTNLLALNAAVEAARAGEAGAGFAVVADEVRSLALRAADSARTTAGLIEATVKRIKDGAGLVTSTNDAFAEVAQSAAKVGELIGEISSASQEQAQGIEQVTSAVAEIDKVTQDTAANAEESASASEEMKLQAMQMQGFVNRLVVLVGGKVNNEDGQPWDGGKDKAAVSRKTGQFARGLANP